MASDTETLAEFVKRVRRDRKLSLDEVEGASRRRGGGISNGYISQIENGHNTNPSLSALIALAAGLGVSEDELFDVARGKRRRAPAVYLLDDLDEEGRLYAEKILAALKAARDEIRSSSADGSSKHITAAVDDSGLPSEPAAHDNKSHPRHRKREA